MGTRIQVKNYTLLLVSMTWSTLPYRFICPSVVGFIVEFSLFSLPARSLNGVLCNYFTTPFRTYIGWQNVIAPWHFNYLCLVWWLVIYFRAIGSKCFITAAQLIIDLRQDLRGVLRLNRYQYITYWHTSATDCRWKWTSISILTI